MCPGRDPHCPVLGLNPQAAVIANQYRIVVSYCSSVGSGSYTFSTETTSNPSRVAGVVVVLFC